MNKPRNTANGRIEGLTPDYRREDAWKTKLFSFISRLSRLTANSAINDYTWYEAFARNRLISQAGHLHKVRQILDITSK
jgi:hypothetical protein